MIISVWQAYFPKPLPVCARDRSLRLKNGYGQDDALRNDIAENLEPRRYPSVRNTRSFEDFLA
jgi:hypothetical protein